MNPTIILYILIFIYGIVIGSFLNVCICRIPRGESIVVVRSHCVRCGHQLKWYDLVPLFSYFSLKGKCRKCDEKISVQYPLVEVLNGILYVIIFMATGYCIETLLYCLLVSALITLSVIDFQTYEIPIGINIFILALGLIRLLTDVQNWLTYVIGFFAVSTFLYVIILVTKGRGIGGGDMKLMATCGLLLGFKGIIIAFLIGCILGSVIHVIRMRVSHADKVLALGPYLSIGVFIAMLWGNQMWNWYLSVLGI